MHPISDTKYPTAQKDYACDAAPWIFNGDMNRDCYEYHELRVLAKARKEKWRIKKGTKYVKQVFKDGGELLTFRARPDLHDLCLKYDLYQDC